MTDQIIPLTSDPQQSLKTAVSIGGENKTLQLDIRYNDIADYWVMKITDPATGEILLDSIPLVTGQYPAANILRQFGHLGLGAAYVIKAGNAAMDYPDDTNLGTEFMLVWSDSE